MPETSRRPVLTGGCQCGAVRYALYAMPSDTGLCHCRMCQKAVGGPFAALAPVGLDDFAWTRGTPGLYRSSSKAERGFCARCGTPLSFRYLDEARLSVTTGSLDRPGEAPPLRHEGIEGRQSWLEGMTDWSVATTEASTPAEVLAELVSFQHPDHETPPDWAPPAPKLPDRR